MADPASTIRLPRPQDLGIDPEPIRAQTLLARGPVVCPLAQATGHEDGCQHAHCPFYRAPGTVRTCAVEEWAPFARRRPEVAHWFLARRADFQRGQFVGSR
jgi:hypothetical protein